jgi:hypothetical protein
MLTAIVWRSRRKFAVSLMKGEGVKGTDQETDAQEEEDTTNETAAMRVVHNPAVDREAHTSRPDCKVVKMHYEGKNSADLIKRNRGGDAQFLILSYAPGDSIGHGGEWW